MNTLEISGKYNIAKVFTESIEQNAISQLITLMNQESLAGSQVRIMPDCHSGKGCVVGTTMTIHDSVIPNLVGVDIGCGMLAIKLKEKRINLPEFDSIVRKNIPSGGSVHNHPIDDFNLSELRCIQSKGKIKQDLAHKSIGTLGGGNHFIELDKDSSDNIWLVIHTGSRHLGLEVCDHYQKKAYDELVVEANNGTLQDKLDSIKDRLKAEGRAKEIQFELNKFRKEYVPIKPKVPFELAYCKGQLMQDYLHDMRIVQSFAVKNRQTIAKLILKYAKLHGIESFDTIHNYIDLDSMILRKGSISAQNGEIVLIPMNMRDGSLICRGKGNPDWNFSAPHGAGRLMSRSDAKANISVSEYKKTMKDAGIFSTSVGAGTVDESPMAYKPADEIKSLIADTVDILDEIHPIYNFKASDIDD